MPTPVTRFALATAVCMAALAFGGVGTGVAVADPDEPSNSSTPTGSPEPSNVDKTTSVPTPTVPTTVRSLPEQIRDLLHKPLSIFGNGRVPGQAPTTTSPSTAPSGAKEAETTHTIEGVIPRKTEKPAEVAPPRQAPVVGREPTGSTAEVRLPFTPAFTVPVPSVPGAGDTRWSINLTDPSSAYATLDDTFATFNSLIADAYEPYNPWPKPKPQPALRTFQEGPVLDANGSSGGDGVTPVSAGPGGDLPVLHAPPVVVPRPAPPGNPGAIVRGASPVPEIVAGGSAGAQTPGLRGSLTQTGTTAAEPVSASSAAQFGTPAVRQGYAPSLRVARVGEIAVVAVPGLAGLLALTFSGGVIGYRQANSGRYLRQEAVRFVR